MEGESTGATGLAAFEGLDVAGHAVLVRTGWDLHFGTEAYGAPEHPFLATEAAAWLADQGVALVGIDSVNIDDTRGGERQVHTLLLEREIPVVEHLTGCPRCRRPGRRSPPYLPRSPACRRSRCGPSRHLPAERPGSQPSASDASGRFCNVDRRARFPGYPTGDQHRRQA